MLSNFILLAFSLTNIDGVQSNVFIVQIFQAYEITKNVNV